jgi:tripeptidyl-peptidase I
MNFFTLSLVVFILALEALAEPTRKAAHRDHGWTRKFLAPRDGQMKLHIALRQEDGGKEAERRLMAVSDPRSQRFRQHLGPEAAYLSTPAQGSVHDFEYWLWKYDLLKDASLIGGIFEIDTTIRRAEKLLNTTYFVWTDGIQEVVRTELFYLPDTVAKHIDFVAPTTTFPRRRAIMEEGVESE